MRPCLWRCPCLTECILSKVRSAHHVFHGITDMDSLTISHPVQTSYVFPIVCKLALQAAVAVHGLLGELAGPSISGGCLQG